jgi:hypothetical protein
VPYRMNPQLRRFQPCQGFRWGMGYLGMGNVSIDSLAQAIAQMEGYNKAGSIAQRNNNPGNLRSGQGQVGTSGGYAVFATPEDGFAALNHQIELNASRGLTLNEFFAGKPGVYGGYAPSADSNDPVNYAAFVANRLGADPNVPISSLLAGDQGGSNSGSQVDPASGLPVDTSAPDTGGSGGGPGLSGTAWAGIAMAAVGLWIWAAG